MVDNPSTNAHNQSRPGRGHQIMPAITFANGRLTLLYYDLRLDHYENIYTSAPKTSDWLYRDADARGRTTRHSQQSIYSVH